MSSTLIISTTDNTNNSKILQTQIFANISSSLIVFLLIAPVIFVFLYLLILNFFKDSSIIWVRVINGSLIFILGVLPAPLLLFLQSASVQNHDTSGLIFFGDYYVFLFTIILMKLQSSKCWLLILMVIFILVWLPLLHSSEPFLSIIPIDKGEIEKYGDYFYKLRLINTLFFLLYGLLLLLFKKASGFIRRNALVEQKTSLRALILFLAIIYIYSIIMQVISVRGVFRNHQSLSYSALWLFYINACVLLALVCVLVCKAILPIDRHGVETSRFFSIKDQIYNFKYLKTKFQIWRKQYTGSHRKLTNYGLNMLISCKNDEQLLYSSAIVNGIRTLLQQEFDVVWGYEYQKKYLLFFLAYSPENIPKNIAKIYMSHTIRYAAINRIFSEYERQNKTHLNCKIISYGLLNDNMNSITKQLVLNQYNYAFEQISRFVRRYNAQINISEKKNYVLLERFLAEDRKNLAFNINYVDVIDQTGIQIGYHLDIEKFYEFYDAKKYENIFKRYLIYKAFEKLTSTTITGKIFFINASSKMFYDSQKWKSGLKHTLNRFQKLNNTICVIFTENEYCLHFKIIKKIIVFQQHFSNLEICISECTFSQWILENIKILKIKYVIPLVDHIFGDNDEHFKHNKMRIVGNQLNLIAVKYDFYLISTTQPTSESKKRVWCILNYKYPSIIKYKKT